MGVSGLGAEDFVGEFPQRFTRLVEGSSPLGCGTVTTTASALNDFDPRAQQAFVFHPMQHRIQSAGTDPMPVAGEFLGDPRTVYLAVRGVMQNMKLNGTAQKRSHPASLGERSDGTRRRAR